MLAHHLLEQTVTCSSITDSRRAKTPGFRLAWLHRVIPPREMGIDPGMEQLAVFGLRDRRSDVPALRDLGLGYGHRSGRARHLPSPSFPGDVDAASGGEGADRAGVPCLWRRARALEAGRRLPRHRCVRDRDGGIEARDRGGPDTALGPTDASEVRRRRRQATDARCPRSLASRSPALWSNTPRNTKA